MKTKKIQENKNKHIYPYPNDIKLNHNEQELFEEKLHLNLNQYFYSFLLFHFL